MRKELRIRRGLLALILLGVTGLAPWGAVSTVQAASATARNREVTVTATGDDVLAVQSVGTDFDVIVSGGIAPVTVTLTARSGATLVKPSSGSSSELPFEYEVGFPLNPGEDSAIGMVKREVFDRPGTMTLIGANIEQPAWVNTSSNSVNGSSHTGSDTNTKTLGISYQSDNDKSSGKVTQRRFRYVVEVILISVIDVEIGDFGSVEAAAGVYVAKNGTQKVLKYVGCARKDTSISVTIGPISATIPLPGQNDNNLQQTLPYEDVDNNVFEHRPGEEVSLILSLTGWGTTKTSGGWFSHATAGAYIKPYTLTPAEKQFTTMEAIKFIP